jgi:hypothetical protein
VFDFIKKIFRNTPSSAPAVANGENLSPERRNFHNVSSMKYVLEHVLEKGQFLRRARGLLNGLPGAWFGVWSAPEISRRSH